ncbi:MAG: hypothetical protein DRO13_05675 [Thermoprotei archaeon]|nr:MAG: hypothetical protein DRO13_05675 [Thermoprotei archaeon]
MWIYVFGKDLVEYSGRPWYSDAVRSYVGLAYGSLGLISLGSVAATLTDSIQQAYTSIRYVIKYTKLGPHRFLFEDVLSSLISLVIVAVVITATTTTLAWLEYGVLVIPSNSAGLLLDLLLIGVFMLTPT